MDSANRMPKALYLSALAGGWALAFILGAAVALADSDAAAALGFLIALVLIGMAVILLRFWYQAWASIQDGHARTSPGRAIGFMFIPFFNLYWMFQLIWGLSVDFNKYLSRHDLGLEPLSEKMFLAIPILALVTWVPVLGLLASIALLVLYVVAIIKVCDTVNSAEFRTPEELAAN